jgi:hypothetical protein
MNSTLLRTTAVRSALRAAAPSTAARAGVAGTTFVRGKATLPDLSCTSSQYLGIPYVPKLTLYNR